MEPKRFLLEGPTLRELQERVVAEHGANATIIAAERVTVGGIRGFFARQHYEITVEVLEPSERKKSAHAGLDISARLGIAALLDDADEAEFQLHPAQPSPQLSTTSDGFAKLMDELTFATGRDVVPDAAPEPVADAVPARGSAPAPSPARPALARPPVPAPLTRPGDLVLIVGLEEDPLTIARLMLRVAGAGELRIAGTLLEERIERVDDRRGAMLARAHGVDIGHSTFIAYGLEPASDALARAATLTAIGADQVWVVVDASRKPEDTIRWVNMVVTAIQVHAVAALGRQFTTSPATVDDLGLPVEWMDGRVAAAPTGRRAAPPHSRPTERER
ncbi:MULTISPECIES: hypothetical protein [unclassified Cryobacterium]|uniref:hypothetical protein n=1 Tax=unclassified Cryobacterium TaxID=2649013 RepID=UPI00106A284A|nr:MULTISPECIES: hypothetical protein [unclassified Cryobacterium]TFD03530.1 hypothetical protein E3T29_16990 [Cryobacterium sp. TMT1-66-1]TFD12793.1 hypothetical protein E3T35_05725 [Cryobacterium sp. TMT1-2-2]